MLLKRFVMKCINTAVMRFYTCLCNQSLATNRYYSVHKKTSKPSTVKLQKLIEEYSQFSPSPISLRQFIDFG